MKKANNKVNNGEHKNDGNGRLEDQDDKNKTETRGVTRQKT